MSKLLQMLLVDPRKGAEPVLVEDDLEAFYKVLGCEIIDIVNRRIGDGRYSVICDDEGLYNDPTPSAISESGDRMFVGRLLIAAAEPNDDGDLMPLTDSEVQRLLTLVCPVRMCKQELVMLTNVGY